MELNVNNIVNKIEKQAENLSTVYAIIADPIDGGRGLNGMIPFAVDRLSHWKIPDPQEILFYVMQPQYAYAKNIKNAVIAYLAGMGAEAIGQDRIGQAAKNVATGLAKGTAIAALLWLPAINSHNTHKPTDFTGQGMTQGQTSRPSNPAYVSGGGMS